MYKLTSWQKVMLDMVTVGLEWCRCECWVNGGGGRTRATICPAILSSPAVSSFLWADTNEKTMMQKLSTGRQHELERT